MSLHTYPLFYTIVFSLGQKKLDLGLIQTETPNKTYWNPKQRFRSIKAHWIAPLMLGHFEKFPHCHECTSTTYVCPNSGWWDGNQPPHYHPITRQLQGTKPCAVAHDFGHGFGWEPINKKSPSHPLSTPLAVYESSMVFPLNFCHFWNTFLERTQWKTSDSFSGLSFLNFAKLS